MDLTAVALGKLDPAARRPNDEVPVDGEPADGGERSVVPGDAGRLALGKPALHEALDVGGGDLADELGPEGGEHVQPERHVVSRSGGGPLRGVRVEPLLGHLREGRGGRPRVDPSASMHRRPLFDFEQPSLPLGAKRSGRLSAVRPSQPDVVPDASLAAPSLDAHHRSWLPSADQAAGGCESSDGDDRKCTTEPRRLEGLDVAPWDRNRIAKAETASTGTRADRPMCTSSSSPAPISS